MLFRRYPQRIEDNPRLHARQARLRIKGANKMYILGKIQNHCGIAALAGKARTSAAREQRRAEFAAGRNSENNIFNVAGHDNADGDLAVVGCIRGEQGPGSSIKANIAFDRLPEP
jgi:hypothetical protein